MAVVFLRVPWHWRFNRRDEGGDFLHPLKHAPGTAPACTPPPAPRTCSCDSRVPLAALGPAAANLGQSQPQRRLRRARSWCHSPGAPGDRQISFNLSLTGGGACSKNGARAPLPSCYRCSPSGAVVSLPPLISRSLTLFLALWRAVRSLQHASCFTSVTLLNTTAHLTLLLPPTDP